MPHYTLFILSCYYVNIKCIVVSSVWVVSDRLAYLPPVHKLQFEKFLRIDNEFSEFIRLCFKFRQIAFTKRAQINLLDRNLAFKFVCKM
jgi:hypothetical protein